MRSKTEWTVNSDGGKNKPVRVGLAPEQGKWIEYEFDMLMEMTPEHYANIIKDRTGRYQDKMLEKPWEEFGQDLLAWLNEGVEVKKEDLSKQTIAIDEAFAKVSSDSEKDATRQSLIQRIQDSTTLSANAKADLLLYIKSK